METQRKGTPVSQGMRDMVKERERQTTRVKNRVKYIQQTCIDNLLGVRQVPWQALGTQR